MKRFINVLVVLTALLVACTPQTAEPSVSDDAPVETPDLREDPNYIETRTADLPTPFSQEEEQRPVTDPIVLEASDPLYDFVNEMKTDLAERLDTVADQIDLVALQPVEWPDGSLGCPEPGMAYLQVITPGYQLTFSSNDTFYNYHTKGTTFFTLCEDSAGFPKSGGTPAS